METLAVEKDLAARAAIRHVRAGMRVALGTGSTAAYAIRALAARFAGKGDLDAVASSAASETLARELGLSVRPLERVSWERFRAIVQSGADGRAGQEFVFDRLGADTLARARIPLRIVHGRDLDNLEAALRGRAFRGTTVG